jgi:FkbM family methyltransferase
VAESPRSARSRFAEWRLRRRLAGPNLLRAFADAYPEAYFVEIGAHDGDEGNVLRPFVVEGGWSGLMVEPVPYVFERLRRNYEGLDRVAVENAAIAESDGVLPFFHLAEARGAELEALPDWYSKVGSFSREIVLGHRNEIPDVERRIVSTEVPCLTLGSLCEKHDVGRIDLLLVDAEGHDREIVEQLDLDERRPRILVYEHIHLPAAERRELRAWLEDGGYETKEEFLDTWCLDTRPDDAVTRRWRRVRDRVDEAELGRWFEGVTGRA